MEKLLKGIITLLFELLKLQYFIILALVRLFIPVRPKDVSNEIVLVTGGAQGIGREIAIGYGRLQATVVCVDVNTEANNETVADLKRDGVKAFAYACDISSKEEVLKLAKTIEKEVGPVTIVVNNAGVLSSKPIEELTERQIRQTFDVNVIAHFWMVQAFLPGMLQRDSGHIVAVSSCAGLVGTGNLSAYSATKWAVRGFMASLAKELEDRNSNVKLTTVMPFFVDTTMCKKPKVGLLWLISPRAVAKSLIKAQRTDVEEVTVPFYLHQLVNAAGFVPHQAKKSMERAFGFGAEPSD